MSRPGVMFYFELRPALKRLSLEEKGLLFESILEYAELGVLPQLDGAVGVAWDFVQPRIDADAVTYEAKVRGSAYSNYCKSAKMAGATPLSRDDWEREGCKPFRTEPNGTERNPNSKSNSDSNSKPDSESKANRVRGGANDDPDRLKTDAWRSLMSAFKTFDDIE